MWFLNLKKVKCLLGHHQYPFFQLKELFWNPDVDLGGNLACITLSQKCIHCGHVAVLQTKVFKATQLPNMPDKKREKLIRAVFDRMPGYKPLL